MSLPQYQAAQQVQIVVPSSGRTGPNSPVASSASHASLVGCSGASLMTGTTIGSSSSSTQNASRTSLKFEPAEPIPASKIKRNDRKRIIPETDEIDIEPVMTDFDHPQVYDNWEPQVHPDGALYFFDSTRRVYTDADLSVVRELDIINHHANQLLEEAKKIDGFPSVTCELVLERTNLKRTGCGYYFVEPKKRCIFWLDRVSSKTITRNLPRVQSLSHIKYVMEAEYWAHCMHFPNRWSVTAEVVAELKKMVLHAVADNVASTLSVIPFDQDELAKILDLIDGLKDGIEELYPHANSIIARFMQDFALAKFFNFCGQPGARLNSDQLIFQRSNPRRSMLIVLLSFCLFWAPCDYAKELDGIWVDKAINRVLWKQFIVKLTNDWSNLALTATVILNANVVFLAISGNAAARSFSLVSTITSMGVVVIGLVLVRQNQRKDQDSAEQASKFLGSVLNEVFGLEWLAIVYSLPYALLMWSMVWFIIAFACMVLGSSPPVTTGTFGTAGLILLSFVFGTVWTTHATRTAR